MLVPLCPQVYDSTLWQTISYCANFNLYAPRVARPLIPSQGKFFMMGVRGSNNPSSDRYNVRTREIVSRADLDDWATEELL
eukprot:SAG31_NODE_13373_length_874_cov_0.864516_2_plen_81_part_00